MTVSSLCKIWCHGNRALSAGQFVYIETWHCTTDLCPETQLLELLHRDFESYNRPMYVNDSTVNNSTA